MEDINFEKLKTLAPSTCNARKKRRLLLQVNEEKSDRTFGGCSFVESATYMKTKLQATVSQIFHN